MNIRQINLFLLVAFLLGMFSCDDHYDYSKQYTPTAEEQAILDSIAYVKDQIARGTLVLEYKVDVTISPTSYEGTRLEIELDRIAEKFNITVAELVDGIMGVNGAPEIKGFAKNSNGEDDLRATTSGAKWGHWWDADGNVITWGTNAMTFAEFNISGYPNSFHIGQYPDRLKNGQKIKIIECLSYGELRVEVVINITFIEKVTEMITAPVVDTQKLSIDVVTRYDTGMDFLRFNVESALRNLGVFSFDDARTVAGNEIDGYVTEYIEGSLAKKGFWYNVESGSDKLKPGNTNGTNSRVYTSLEKDTYGNTVIGIGQRAGACEEFAKYVIEYGILANNKIVMFEITVNILESPLTIVNTQRISIGLAPRSNYDMLSVPFNVSSVLSNLEITSLTNASPVTVKSDGSFETATNAGSFNGAYSGFWFTMDGFPCAWGNDARAYTSIEKDANDNYVLGVGQFPDRLKDGDKLILKHGFVNLSNRKIVIIELTVNIDEYDALHKFEYEVNVPTSATSYDGAELKIELDKIAEKFGITEAQLVAGIMGEAGAPAIRGFAKYSTGADDYRATNSGAKWGHWWDADGNITAWGPTAMTFAEFNVGSFTNSFHIGQFPDRLQKGQKITFVEGLMYNKIRVEIVIKLTAI